MNPKKRDELLIKMAERQHQMHQDLIEVKKVVPVVIRHESDLKWIKWLGGSAVTVLGGVVGIIEWFKK